MPVISTGMAERLAEQKAMRRHRLVRRALVVTSVVAFLSGAAWAVLYSSLLSFDADRLTVDGTGSSVDAAAIVAVVAEYDGTSLALVDTVTLRGELLEVPNVRDVSISRQWPSGLAVVVVAREPVAAVPVADGVALLDQDAVQVGVVAVAPPELPLITIPLTGEDRRTLEAALVVLNSLPDDLAAEVGSLSATTQDSVTLTLRDGVVVEWGSSQESELKSQVLATLRTAEVSRGSSVFDVSAPTFPITR
ncbi:cell division protein FtsQ/DivIB [Sanguibacter antarcticus]|uniref:cell division protein FtsQ/DivIB n=1 Tax=Sanguibacter antarcticus TaxID=372484 RepID=UPI001473FDDB|nr:cell division protein FtsQ/DivIB [Sanguibacter antarcticus]